MYSPTNNPCPILLTVTVLEVIIVVKVQPVIALVSSNGVISKNWLS
jgi:hypothetical protein